MKPVTVHPDLVAWLIAHRAAWVGWPTSSEFDDTADMMRLRRIRDDVDQWVPKAFDTNRKVFRYLSLAIRQVRATLRAGYAAEIAVVMCEEDDE